MVFRNFHIQDHDNAKFEPTTFFGDKGGEKKQTEIHIEFFRGGPGIFVVVRAFTFFTRFS